MSDDEDDYLSAKYLVDTPATTTAAPKTYSQIRKEKQKKGYERHEQTRPRGRRERELEAREAGLSKSLFERAKEEEEAGLASGNKALSIMMKMGFKPGQSLGKLGDDADADAEGSTSPKATTGPSATTAPLEAPRASLPTFVSASSANDSAGPTTSASTRPALSSSPGDGEAHQPHTTHMKVPLPLDEWAGKTGIGLRKRARSPTAPERLAKMAKMAEDAKGGDYRSRARDEYHNRKAEGQLGPAQRTCATLDEQAGKEFNVLWLNPNDSDTFPPGLIDALTMHSNLLHGVIRPARQGDPTISTVRANSATTTTHSSLASSEAQRLRMQMQADALQPLSGDEDEDSARGTRISAVSAVDQYSSEMLEEATQFLRLQAQDRLQLVLSYLRERYAYCFWCGITYESDEDMERNCPGPNEDDHD